MKYYYTNAVGVVVRDVRGRKIQEIPCGKYLLWEAKTKQEIAAFEEAIKNGIPIKEISKEEYLKKVAYAIPRGKVMLREVISPQSFGGPRTTSKENVVASNESPSENIASQQVIPKTEKPVVDALFEE